MAPTDDGFTILERSEEFEQFEATPPDGFLRRFVICNLDGIHWGFWPV